MNILDLIDLLDDDLGDYPYQLKYVSRISSYKKYKNPKLKILKSSIETERINSDGKDIWNVKYTYNKNGVLQSVKKMSEDGEVSYERKLISKNATKYKYKTYKNVESRYEDNNEVTFDVGKNTYSILQSHFQFGLVKEETSQLNFIFYKREFF